MTRCAAIARRVASAFAATSKRSPPIASRSTTETASESSACGETASESSACGGDAAARPLLVVNPHALHNRGGIEKQAARIVDVLTLAGIDVELCTAADLPTATRLVGAAVRGGCPLVIAAGGDGTIEAVAPTLVNTPTALGIIPLGTYNNLAVSIGIPTDVQAACDVIANGVPAPIDVGEVRCHGSHDVHYFLEQASIGLGPLLAPIGEDFEKAHWLDAFRRLPAALSLEPVAMRLRLDDDVRCAETLLATICNAPRSAASLVLAPEARMNDGLLDLCVYEGLHQAQLASMLFDFMSTGVRDRAGVWRTLVRSVEISSTSHQRLLVAADAEVIGETPARFSVLPGALRVMTDNFRETSQEQASRLPGPSKHHSA